MRLVASIASMALWALSVWADLAWSGPQDIIMGPAGGIGTISQLIVDLDNSGTDDYLLMYTSVFNGAPSTGNATVADGSGTYALPLTAGSPINDANAWDEGSLNLLGWMEDLEDGGQCVGPWCGVQNGYLGVRFQGDDGSHYGWLRISASGDIPTATVHDWAYETSPGVGISAGVVPEPSTIVLLAIGLSVLGVRWRLGGKPQ